MCKELIGTCSESYRISQLPSERMCECGRVVSCGDDYDVLLYRAHFT